MDHEPRDRTPSCSMKILKSLSFLFIFVVSVLLILFQSKANGSSLLSSAHQELVQQEISVPAKEKLLLDEIVYGALSARTFNGTWISDSELLFRDYFGHLLIQNLSTFHPETVTLVANSSTLQEYHAQKYSLSPDRLYLLLVYDVRKIFRHTYSAEHLILRISDLKRIKPIVQAQSLTIAGTHLQYASWGPLGSQLVMVQNGNIFYKDCAECEATQITDTRDYGVVLNGIPDWLYEEEILSKGDAIWFSEKGSKFCYASFNDSGVDVVSFPAFDATYQLNSRFYHVRYPKPGRMNPTVVLWVVDVTSSEKHSIRILPPAEIAESLICTLPESEYYFTTVTWINEEVVMVTWVTREQNYASISTCQAGNSSSEWLCTTIEPVVSADGWVDIYENPVCSSGKCFVRLPQKISDSEGAFKHIAMISIDKRDVRFLTTGSYETTGVLKFDPHNNALFYQSTLPGRPGQRHLFVTRIDDGRQNCLTCDLGPDCTYTSSHFSRDSSFYVLECLGPGVPRVEIRMTEGNRLYRVIQNNDQLKHDIGMKSLPRIWNLSVPVAGGYNASVRLLLPPRLKENEITKYPLLVHVYGGPGSQQVSERFFISWGHRLAASMNIIYALIDGRGSGYKGDKILHEIYHRFGTVEVDDQTQVTRYLQDHFPFIDRKNTGIWGWSYGGYVTAMALARDKTENPVFSCGISVAPVTDWLLYDSAYTERYMSSPLRSEDYANYVTASVLNKARNIKGKKYLLIHGTADDNVHVAHSMLWMKALTQNGVLFRSQVYPDENHGLVNVARHLYQTMEEFLTDCYGLKDRFDEVGLRKARLTPLISD